MSKWRWRAAIWTLAILGASLEAIKRGYDDEPVDGVARARLPSFRRSARRSRDAATRIPPPPPPPSPRSLPVDATTSCRGEAHLELAGEVVPGGWGADPSNRVDAPGRCCELCRANPRCDAWVHCGDAACGDRRGQCWLKRQPELRPGDVPIAQDMGPTCPWTSGYLRRGDGDGVHGDWVNGEGDGDGDGDGNGDISGDLPGDSHDRSARARGDISGDRMFRRLDPTAGAAFPPARARECGDPAVDGYARVDPKCLETSRTNREFDASPAARAALVAWYEPHASYDGLAVRWGIGHRAESARACASRCRDHAPGLPDAGPFANLPCNAWVWCPTNIRRCFEPDAHTHGAGDCWLKFTETPESPQVNQRGANDDRRMDARGTMYRSRHPDAPATTHWTSGVMLPPGQSPSNGTFGPRATW